MQLVLEPLDGAEEAQTYTDDKEVIAVNAA
jgi:hypothetical protein